MIVATRRTVLGLPDFSPRQMHGLAVWLRSDQGVLSDGASQFTAANSESLSHADDATLNVTTSDFSLAVWVKTSAAAASGLIAKRDRSGNNPGYALEMAADGTVTVTICDGSGAPIVATSTSTVNNNAWHLIVATADRDGNAAISIDGGAAEGAAAISAQALTLTNTRTFYIGAGDNAGLERYLTGALALASLWKRLLTAGEITSLYAAGVGLAYNQLSISQTSLVSFWGLKEPSSTRADAVGGMTLTDNNTVTAAVGPNTSAATDGEAVSQWNDLSRNANHLTQATTASRPIFKAGIVAGRAVVRFDGVDDFLRVTFGTALSQPNTICIVYKMVNMPAVASLLAFDGVTGGRNALYAKYPEGVWAYYAGTEQSGVAYDNVFNVHTGIFNGASSALYKNGAVISTGNPGAQALNGVTLAADNADGANMQADIAEVIVYNRALSAGERSRVDHYAGNLYAVAVS